MGPRDRNSSRVVSFQNRRRTRRRLIGKRSPRVLILFLLAIGLAVGAYYKHEGHPTRWLAGAGGRSVDNPSERSLPRALRGGNAMQRTGNARAGHTMTIDAPTGAVVTHVRDGDTIEVGGRPIRIAALDCAESGSVAGDAATRHMKALVSGQRVNCSFTGERSYDRWIGSCRLSDGRDIAGVLIGERLCRRWR